MTCIVGITDGRTVTVGGDSAGSDGWHVVALGSLHSTARSSAGSRHRAVMALETAAELTEGVRPPFTVVESE
ncbi:hypothetical protein [Actinoplanes sp. NPDC048796]|uniref:hypothetical protein n=1 Tax=Actinoplanes sp. NPDC048796 TaxID=3155640 RepID=UPI0034058875